MHAVTTEEDMAIEVTTDLSDGDTMWAAVQTKDETYIDAFVQGVSSAGIYCRSTCPSRTPKRTNLTFFKSWQDAEAGGFRACKRCLPSTAHSRHPHVCWQNKSVA
jgi:methylphosphotriester-DNA--protein-cysteine methyltransferase|tara:strand:- start:72 stop:386 length:315 start_codon:yes stop_codon:yes gene_type:complete